MANPDDSRIPLTLLKGPEALAAWLSAGGPAALVTDGPPPGGLDLPMERFDAARSHRIGCACCAGRSPAAIALDRLFLARVRGGCAWFDRVGALIGAEPGRRQLADALDADLLTRARFRPG